MRRTLAFASCALMLLGACASGPSGAQTYAVDLDAPSPEGTKLQVSAYFPGSLKANAGDTIVFRNRSTEAPHTVTFGVLADRSNQPQLLTPDGENPAAFGPCYSEDNATPELARCPSTELPAFGGTGYWNSGLLQAAPVPDEAGAKEIEVELTDDIAPGNYAYVCVLHPFMNGTLQIVEEESDREAPDDVTTEAGEARDDALADAENLEAPELERDGETQVVSAGWGDRVSAVNLFAPAQLDVKTGTDVRWVARSPYEPHTITFESTFEPEDPASFQPSGVESGSEYTGGPANSGLVGAEGGPFGTSFELTFTEPGEYSYVCALHPGQEGVVRVTE